MNVPQELVALHRHFSSATVPSRLCHHLPRRLCHGPTAPAQTPSILRANPAALGVRAAVDVPVKKTTTKNTTKKKRKALRLDNTKPKDNAQPGWPMPGACGERLPPPGTPLPGDPRPRDPPNLPRRPLGSSSSLPPVPAEAPGGRRKWDARSRPPPPPARPRRPPCPTWGSPPRPGPCSFPPRLTQPQNPAGDGGGPRPLRKGWRSCSCLV